MEVISLDKVKGVKNLILTIGSFDGLHLGHQKVIRTVVSEAKKRGGISAVLTFNRHPRSVIEKIKIPFLISPEEKFKLLDKWSVDLCIIANFNQKFIQLSPERLCEEILKKRLAIKEIIASSAFRFGKKRIGDVQLLKEIGKRCDFSVKVIRPLKIKNVIVSSSLIRNLVKEARLKEVSTYLGRDFSVLGKVIPGERRGRILGYPTANLKVDYFLNLPYGVYAIKAKINKKEYDGLSNIGLRPTFSSYRKFPTIEVYLFDFDGDLYNKMIKVIFKQKIRNEIDFSKNKLLLLKQIKKDEKKAKKILATTEGRR